MDSQGRQLHGEAAKARESGNFVEALKLLDQALIAYQEAGDKLGFSEAISDRSITLRHLSQQTNDNDYLKLAESEMKAAIEIAQGSGNSEALSIPLFNLAQTQEDLGKYDEAIKNYQESISKTSAGTPGAEISSYSPAQNRPAYLANMKTHLAHAEYKNGNKKALEEMEQAIKDLENSEEPDFYSKNVWLSGSYMRTTDMLKDDDPQKAKEYLQKAKEIIDSDERLTLRKKQWEKLAASFN